MSARRSAGSSQFICSPVLPVRAVGWPVSALGWVPQAVFVVAFVTSFAFIVGADTVCDCLNPMSNIYRKNLTRFEPERSCTLEVGVDLARIISVVDDGVRSIVVSLANGEGAV